MLSSLVSGTSIQIPKRSYQETSKLDTRKKTRQKVGDHQILSGQYEGDCKDIAGFRRQLGIRVCGDDCPPPLLEWGSLKFPHSEVGCHRRDFLLASVERSVWKEPTAVQMQTIPILCAGRDIAVCSPTGSGKTGAFAIAALVKLSSPPLDRVSAVGPRVLFIAPTRELAAQIHRETVCLATGSAVPVNLLTKPSTRTTGVLVSTPVQLVASLRKGDLCLSCVELVVVDEADRLFDDPQDRVLDSSGRLNLLDQVLEKCDHSKVQRALFSATLTQRVAQLVTSILRDPLNVSIGLANTGAISIEQSLRFVGRDQGKLVAIRHLIQEGLRPPALIFVRNGERAKELHQELIYDGVNVDRVDSDLSFEKQKAAIRRFRLGKVWVLVCTDHLARGIDFKGVKMVINYDFPTSSVSYIHRIGRTGRSGESGHAITFFTEADVPALRSIANVIRLSGGSVPDWMLSLRKARDGQKAQKQPPKGKSRKSTSLL